MKKKKKKALKMTSQLIIFIAFFSSLFSRPPTMNLKKKKNVIQLIKKIWPKLTNWTTGVTSWFHFWKYIYHIFKICI